ncbi:MAG: PLDc N-terminal domain-containing protein [Chthoniobacterales bacterium]|nr:PLDc N-terminal domain-containing protein [Chthoniobacterales bacterium]
MRQEFSVFEAIGFEIGVILFVGWALVSWVWSAVIAVIQLVGFALACHAVMNSRTPQAAIGWAIGLIFVPWLSIPFYLIFGQSKFSGYELAGRGEVPELDAVKLRVKVLMEPYRCQFPSAYEDLTRLCERVSGLPTTTGNDLELLVDGEQTFDSIFEAIRSARRWVVAQLSLIHI